MSTDGNSQRARVLDAMVAVVGERGFAATSVEAVVGRARVSRRTFYAHFPSLQACFAAVLDDALERSGALISEAIGREASWDDGVRGALASLLVFFDSNPLLTRVWMIEAVAAGSWAFEQRERSLALLRELIVAGWRAQAGTAAVPQTADSPEIVAVMAAVIGVIHAHLIVRRPQPLVTLLGPLTGIVAASYLPPREVAREVARSEELASALLASPYPPASAGASTRRNGSGVEVPDTLRDPRAHRARACLLYVAATPGASNRQIGEGAGVASRTQTSMLLRRLCEQDLIAKTHARPGQSNAWSATPHGERVAEALRG